MIKRLDVVIIAAALLLCGILFFVMQIDRNNENEKARIEISVNGEETQSIEIPLDATEEKWIEGVAGKLLIRVEPDGVLVVSADCPSQDCVHVGKITEPGQIIACLPNRVLIKLVGGTGQESEVDVIAS